MANLAYSKLKLKTKSEITEIEIAEGLTIEVKNYLEAEEKILFVSELVKDSIVDGMIRKDILNPLFKLLVVEKYTNITFTDKQKQDPLKLSDELETNGVADAIISAIPETEMKTIVEFVEDYGIQMSKATVSSIAGFASKQREEAGQVEFMKALIESGSFDDFIKENFDLGK